MTFRNKRGSHIDAIISFIVFIGIIIFLYAIIQPKIATQQDKMTALNYIEAKILENVSGNLTTIPVRVTGSGSCFNLSGFLSNANIDSPHLKASYGSVGYDAGYSGGEAYVSNPSAENLPGFFTIANSPEFPEQSSPPAGCQALAYQAESNGYFIGEVSKGVYAFSSNIENLISSYGAGYNSLKSQFSVPTGTDFGFSFTYQNRTNIGTEDKYASSNVYVESFPIQYVNGNGSIQAGNLAIRVW